MADDFRIAVNAQAEQLALLALRDRLAKLADSEGRAIEPAEPISFPEPAANLAADPDLVERVGLPFCRQHEVVPLAIAGDCVVVAHTRPTLDVVERLARLAAAYCAGRSELTWWSRR